MSLSTVRRTGLVNQALEQMRELIASGEWHVGERIPPEHELAEALSVGRSTVREAVRALVHTGVLTVRRGDGTRVSAVSELSGVVRRELEGVDARYVVEVRRALDVEAARLAATRRTATDLAELERLLAARELALVQGDVWPWVETDLAFHLGVARAVHNPILSQLYSDFTAALQDSIAATVSAGLGAQTLIDHGSLLQAIRHGDPDAAAAEARCVLVKVAAATPALPSR